MLTLMLILKPCVFGQRLTDPPRQVFFALCEMVAVTR